MKFYKPEELKAGMRLAKQIYNKQGVLLYERGLVLTDQIISSVQKFGLLGVLILEPAEPLPPISAEEQEFEQLQTAYMFRLRDSLIAISKGQQPEDLPALVFDLIRRFGALDHPVVFSQTIRSSEDYNYKHAVCTAILCAMIAHRLSLPTVAMNDLVTAALLADFGYLYVPKEIMRKHEDELTDAELRSIEQYRIKALQLLKKDTNPFGLSENTFTTLTEFLTVSRKENPALATAAFHLNTKILLVADKYDRMTAMSLNYQPVTSVQALKHLQKQDKLYDTSVVSALSAAISFLPVGQCVLLSSSRRGMIVSETPGDQFHPQVLDLLTNTIYDLNSPKLRGVIEITDLMTSMDQRYHFDEQSLKHFTPDMPLQVTARRIRLRLEKARRREAAKHARAAAASR
ncbi:MAG: phosphohydrolase [Lachnospiraceae bacterium]|nr:phosphohydrolase [Lachnospiraceae bacterium]